MTIVAPDLTGCQVSRRRSQRQQQRHAASLPVSTSPPAPRDHSAAPSLIPLPQLKPYVAARATPQGKRVPDWEAILKTNGGAGASKEGGELR
jgi:hypothetical protein